MTSQRKGSPPRHLTAVNARAADARALRAARTTGNPHAGPDVGEPQLHVPSFLMANPPAMASPPDPVHQKARQELIAEAAYLRAASRGFAPGHDLDDWLAAEKMVDACLAGGS